MRDKIYRNPQIYYKHDSSGKKHTKKSDYNLELGRKSVKPQHAASMLHATLMPCRFDVWRRTVLLWVVPVSIGFLQLHLLKASQTPSNNTTVI